MSDVSQAAPCVVIVADEVEVGSIRADDAPAPRGETAIVPAHWNRLEIARPLHLALTTQLRQQLDTSWRTVR
jgi:hypothetical protein